MNFELMRHTYEMPQGFNDSEASSAVELVKFMAGNDNHYVGVRGQRYLYNEIDLSSFHTGISLLKQTSN